MRRSWLAAAQLLLLLLSAVRAGQYYDDASPGQLRSRITCYVPSSEPSALPLQLIGHTVHFRDEAGVMHDRRPMTLLYAPYFAGQIFFQDADNYNGVSWYYTCDVSNHFFYHPCIGALFLKLLAQPPAECNDRVPFSGVLFHHNDMVR